MTRIIPNAELQTNCISAILLQKHVNNCTFCAVTFGNYLVINYFQVSKKI